MITPHWISVEIIHSLHEKLLVRYGGSSGIRDHGLLESALARPEQLLHYESANFFELAASYCFGIVKNHPFIDGNKRTGFMCAYIFLRANGYTYTASEEDALKHTVALAASEITEENYAQWLTSTCRKS